MDVWPRRTSISVRWSNDGALQAGARLHEVAGGDRLADVGVVLARVEVRAHQLCAQPGRYAHLRHGMPHISTTGNKGHLLCGAMVKVYRYRQVGDASRTGGNDEDAAAKSWIA